MAQDFIAVLDGLMANPNTGNGYRGANAGYAGSMINPARSGGANHSGGSDFYPGAPTMPSSEGLAGMEQGWMDDTAPLSQPQDEYAGYLAAFNASPYVVTGDSGDGDAAAMTGYQGRSFGTQAGYVGQTINPSGSGGANYSGGSDFYAGAPTMPSSEGLAALERAFGSAGRVPRQPYQANAGYAGSQINPSGSGGANYSGGSDFYPGAPTMPSSEGLARFALRGLLGLGVAPMRAVVGVRRAKPTFVIDPRNPTASAYDAAYKSAIAAGYDRTWASMAAGRVADRANAVGWDLYNTKA